VATRATLPVAAATFVTLANDVVSTLNNETISTYLHNTGANTFRHTDAALLGESDNGPGVYGSVAFASTPQVPFSVGVYGDHGSASGIGVHGVCAESNGIGVRGTASGATGTGVLGEIPSTTSATKTVAVHGINQSSGSGGYGVFGQSTVLHGVVGISGTGAGASGVVAVGTAPGTVGFQSVAQGGATYAGYFFGAVSIQGSLGVTGSKFAVVKGADGQYRGMYAVESPECWFEDVGVGKLVNGTAEITLEPLFAQHIHTETDYHVFVTENGENNALHVTGKTATGFAIQADAATLKAKGKSAAAVNGTFSYRVMAKRNDIEGKRLPVWEMPPETTVSAPSGATPVVLMPKVAQIAPPPASPSRPTAVGGGSGSGTGASGTTNPAMSTVQPAPPPRP